LLGFGPFCVRFASPSFRLVSVGVSLVDGVSEFVKEGASLVTLFGVVDRATWVGVADLV